MKNCKKIKCNKVIHASCVSVFGKGVLILGKAGTGKSSCVLELLSRGHQLIADDLVKVTVFSNHLRAQALATAKNLIHVRGVGFLNIKKIFGSASVRKFICLDFAVVLEQNSKKTNDFLGLKKKAYPVLNKKIPLYPLLTTSPCHLSLLIEILAKKNCSAD